MATRGSYVHLALWENFRGHPENVGFMQFCYFLIKLMVSEVKRFTGLLELIQLYRQNPLEKITSFHYLPQLYIGFKDMNCSCLAGNNFPGITSRFDLHFRKIAMLDLYLEKRLELCSNFPTCIAFYRNLFRNVIINWNCWSNLRRKIIPCCLGHSHHTTMLSHPTGFFAAGKRKFVILTLVGDSILDKTGYYLFQKQSSVCMLNTCTSSKSFIESSFHHWYLMVAKLIVD